jgi:small nuclear ribonucleoprotein (snRNP)-like protein
MHHPGTANPVTHLEQPDMLSRWPVYERVLVNLLEGTAVDGVLIRKSGPLIVLSDCTMYSPGAEPTRLDGNIYIERDQVLYLQTAPAKTPVT